MKTILVPVDFSETAKLALGYGCSLAEALKGTLHLLHVVPEPRLTAGGGAFWHYSAPAFVLRLKDTAEARLTEIASDLGNSTGIERAVRIGKPSREIIRYAQEQRVDLIVLGTGDRRSLTHPLGRVAEDVLRNGPCVTLTARYPDHRVAIS